MFCTFIFVINHCDMFL